MSGPNNIDELPEEQLEEIIEKIEEEVEDIVQEKEALGEPAFPADYNPKVTKYVLELPDIDPLKLARSIAKNHKVEDKFDEILEGDDYRKNHNLARIVDDAVLARPIKPKLRQRVKAWYHRQGSRLKYNAEMILGSILEYPGAALGGLAGSSLFSKIATPQWFEDACAYVASKDYWLVSGWVDGLDYSDTTITLTSMVAAGIAYWSGALYLRNRDEKTVYEKYPEIKKKDTWKFVGFGLFAGLFGTGIRAYVTYKLNEHGFGGTLAALGGTIPSQAFAFTVMNIWGTYSGLVRDEGKLKDAMLKVEEKRLKDEEKLKLKSDNSNYTPS